LLRLEERLLLRLEERLLLRLEERLLLRLEERLLLRLEERLLLLEGRLEGRLLRLEGLQDHLHSGTDWAQSPSRLAKSAGQQQVVGAHCFVAVPAGGSNFLEVEARPVDKRVTVSKKTEPVLIL
jgi:hypothetical protein